jgi:hypothetical protein
MCPRTAAKVKSPPRAGHEGPVEEWRYVPLLHVQVALFQGQGEGTHIQEAGWVEGSDFMTEENFSSPPGFDPRTVQPVASRYTV